MALKWRPFVFVPLAVLAIVAAINYLARDPPEGEVHLVPEGYVGSVFVVYNVPSEAPAPFDQQGRRVYRVSPLGLILTSLPRNDRAPAEEIEFYSVDDRGARVEIPKTWTSDEPAERAVQTRVFSGGAGMMTLYDIGCEFEYESYYVGTLEDLNNPKDPIDLEQYFYQHPEQCPPIPK